MSPVNAVYDGDPAKLARWRGDQASPPSIAVWELTLRCDLGCGHCGSRAGKPRFNELNKYEAIELIRQFAELGLKEITLIGGEFYLRQDWDALAAAIVRAGMICSIVTGARQMTDNRIARAQAAGVGKISVSIDGLERTHDAVRGCKGSWQAAVSAARRIAASGIDVSVNTQMNRLTMPELPGVADLLADIGARSWMVILTAALGRAADRPSLMLQPYHLLHLFPLLAAIKRERLDPRGIAFFPANNVGYFGPLAETLRYGAGSGLVWSGCSAGISTLGIEANGNVKGCPSLPSAAYVRGNIRKHALKRIWSDLVAEKRARSNELWGFCKTCPHAQRCGGGCAWTSHVLFGRTGNNPYCHFRALALSGAGQIEKLKPVQSAPGNPFDHGAFEIVKDDAGANFDDEPVIEKTLASRVFKLRRNASGLWSEDELAKALRPT